MVLLFLICNYVAVVGVLLLFYFIFYRAWPLLQFLFIKTIKIVNLIYIATNTYLILILTLHF